MEEVRQKFRPDVVVVDCGADSLAHDKLGDFNTSIKNHGNCLKLMKSWGLPLMVLGGGGYTIKNVSRCWAYETGLMLGIDLENDIPVNDYYEYYGPDYKLHIQPKADMKDENSNEYLQFIKTKAFLQVKNLEGAPSVDGLNISLKDDFFPPQSYEHRVLQKPEHPAEMP